MPNGGICSYFTSQHCQTVGLIVEDLTAKTREDY